MKKYQSLTSYKIRLKGWRGSILGGSILASLVCLINIALTIYSTANAQEKDDHGRKVLYEGDCDASRKVNVGLHLLINVLSTLLLSASNFGMQCLSAPTRPEIDAAHAKRRWLDIGVLSFRNLAWIERKRLWCWVLLVASSLPLHLFYNSAVYSSIYAVDYMVFMGTEDLVQDPDPTQFLLQTGNVNDRTALLMYESAQSNNLTRLSNEDCMKAYATTFNTGHGSLILVVENAQYSPFSYQYFSNQTIQPPPIVYEGEVSYGGLPVPPCVNDPFGWICGNLRYVACPEGYFWDIPVATQECSLSSIDPDDWKPFGSKVDYCLSESISPRCRVQFVPILAYIVIVFNLAKAGILLYIVLYIREDPLMTMGDAVASFLIERDNSTHDLCLMSKKNIAWWQGDRKAAVTRPIEPHPQFLDTKYKRWSSAVSTLRWMSMLVVYTFVLLGLLAIILAVQLYFHTLPFTQMLELGLGEVNPLTFIGWSISSTGVGGLISNVLVANLAQPILSALYYAYNALFTTMMLSVEWVSYVRERKGLRVSRAPRGSQRSTYTLQLPFRWALPLMAFSAILHWLLSQSLFVVSIEFDHTRLWVNGNDEVSQSFQGAATSVEEFITCGYSLSAVLGALIVGAFLLASVVVVGRRKLKDQAMPVAGSCSAAISASCHLMDGCSAFDSTIVERPYSQTGNGNSKSELTEDGELSSAAYLRLKWGVVGEEVPIDTSRWARTESSSYNGLMLGHCAFSGETVQNPREGVLYAGF